VNVYIETNFILNLGLKQEGYEAVDKIVGLASQKTITLRLPAMAVLEAISTVGKRRLERAQLIKAVDRQLEQAKRSKDRAAAKSLEASIGVLAKLNTQELEDVQGVVYNLMSYARVLSHTPVVMFRAIAAQHWLNIDPVDSMIYAAVLVDLEAAPLLEPSCFLTTDGNLSKKISAELKSHNCRCITRFEDGLEFIRSALA
jgi:hypothetical protein